MRTAQLFVWPPLTACESEDDDVLEKVGDEEADEEGVKGDKGERAGLEAKNRVTCST